MQLVLDTNIVLDWLIFNDPSLIALSEGIRDKRIAVLTHQLAIDELIRVLAYPKLQLDETKQEEVLASYVSQTSVTTMPDSFSLANLLLPDGFPRCSDRDDERFLAVAYHAKADALVSRDKAVLRLRRRAAQFGLRIIDAFEVKAPCGIAPNVSPLFARLL